MAIKVTQVEVWTGTMPDQPGALDAILARLAAAGANLDCVIGRRQPHQPGRGLVYLTPVKGRKAQQAARDAGLQPATNIATLRIESPNKSGLGHRLMSAIAGAGVNVRGISAIASGAKAIAYIGFDSAADAAAAASAIRAAARARR